MEHVSPLKPSFTFYPPHSLTNSAKELINELRLQFQSTSLRTPLIHRLMKIPGTNSSSNNRRTIKSSLLNRTPILPIHPAIKASNETTKSHFMLWIFWKRKKKKEKKKKKTKILWNHGKKCFTLRLMASENCFRLRGVSDNDSYQLFQLLQKKTNPSFVSPKRPGNVSQAIVACKK